MRKKLRKAKGITLIALVITIIVLLILAGVSIATLTGEGGILSKAKKTEKLTNESSAEDKLKLAIMSLQIDWYGNTEGSFRDFIFNHEEDLKKELGDNIVIDKEGKIITVDGIQFSIDENGNITKIEGIVLSNTKVKLNKFEDNEELPNANLVATLVTVTGDVRWKSSDEEVVKISGSGNKVTIIGLKDGVATITATCQGEEATCEVIVRTVIIATEITLNPTSTIIGTGEIVELTATQNGTEEIEWISSDPRIVTVEGAGEYNTIGKIKGVETGTATITAKIQNKIATCSVTVALSSDSLLKAVGETMTGGNKKIIVNGKTDEGVTSKEIYDLNMILVNGDLELTKELGTSGKVKINGTEKSYSDIQDLSISSDGTLYSFGNTNDIGTASAYASNTVVLKINGNLNIGDDVWVTSILGTYGGPKGLIIYCDELSTASNCGITMSSRGAKAVGQNVFLHKNKNGSFSYVSGEGGAGGTKTCYGTMGVGGNGAIPSLFSCGGGGSGGRKYA